MEYGKDARDEPNRPVPQQPVGEGTAERAESSRAREKFDHAPVIGACDRVCILAHIGGNTGGTRL